MDKKDFTSGGVQIDTGLYRPVGAANKAAIVLAYGSDGLIEPWAATMGEHADALARKGFHVLVPDYFLRTGTGKGTINYKQGGVEVVLKNKAAWQDTLADAVKYARTLPGIDASRIGLLGYSLGGYLSLRLRAQAKAIVAFFPPVLDGIGPATTPGLPVQMHYGDADDLRHDRVPIEAELVKGKAVVKSHSYDRANHGFSGPDPDNTDAARKSKARMIEFFEASLS